MELRFGKLSEEHTLQNVNLEDCYLQINALKAEKVKLLADLADAARRIDTCENRFLDKSQ